MSLSQRLPQTETNSTTWNKPTPPIAAQDIAPGCVVFLPKPSFLPFVQCEAPHPCNGHALNDRGFNHPVLVLQTRQREGSTIKGDLLAVVAIITSFTNLNLAQFFAQKRKSKSHFLDISLPIVNQDFDLETLPRGAQVLRIGNGELAKQSYVLVDHAYGVPIARLRSYSHSYPRAFEVRVDEDSMDGLMAIFKMEGQEWESNLLVHARADERLEALCKLQSGVNLTNLTLGATIKGGNETVDRTITGSRVETKLDPRAATFEFLPASPAARRSSSFEKTRYDREWWPQKHNYQNSRQ